MSFDDAVAEIVGDVTRFGSLADRVEGVIEAQRRRYRLNASDWIVLPWSDGFYIFSEDNEGQRRGRECVVAFLGPSVVTIQDVPSQGLLNQLPDAAKSVGLHCASRLHRLRPGDGGAGEMLARLEDMVAAVGGRVWQRLELKSTYGDLLRDFRLALLNRDDPAARRLYGELEKSGQVSAENIRYLHIEYLAAFERWGDLRSLPHIPALLNSRLPQAISEVLVQMIWWTEFAGVSDRTVLKHFIEHDVLQTFGPLLRAARVPSTWEGRLVGLLAALAEADPIRQQEIMDRAGGQDEYDRLQALRSGSKNRSAPETREEDSATDPIRTAYEQCRFLDVVERFLACPSAEYAEMAIEAALELNLTDEAVSVLEIVRGFAADRILNLGRRGRRDLEDLERSVGNVCDGWTTWANRLAGEDRWPDASSVVRNHCGGWTSVADLSADEVATISYELLEAREGQNADQLRGSLDVLCKEATANLRRGVVNDFCQVVLELLSEQENFSEMVRSAYLDLFTTWLEVGPPRMDYCKVLERTCDIWTSISSPNSINWAIGVLEAVVNSPCPDDSGRMTLAVSVIERARQIYGRSGLRARVEVESLAEDLGLPSREVGASDAERDVWSALNGKLVGVYSCLPQAARLLSRRLMRLSAVQVRGNDDKVATPSLRNLAERSDYFIVDTWHATHPATAAIDAVRSKDRQILPAQRGVTGFLRALEAAL